MYNNYVQTDLELMVSRQETILWHAKPDKICLYLESIFNQALPIVILWLLFDGFLIYMLFFAGGKLSEDLPLIGYILFFALHLIPVWIYVFGILTVFRAYKNTEYIITDKGIYTSGGSVTYSCMMKQFSEVSFPYINRGFIDQILGVGDIVIPCVSVPAAKNPLHSKIAAFAIKVASEKSKIQNIEIENIRDYKEVFELIKSKIEEADSLNHQ